VVVLLSSGSCPHPRCTRLFKEQYALFPFEIKHFLRGGRFVDFRKNILEQPITEIVPPIPSPILRHSPTTQPSKTATKDEDYRLKCTKKGRATSLLRLPRFQAIPFSLHIFVSMMKAQRN